MPPVLLMPAKADAERYAVAEAWVQRGGEVRWLEKYWERDEELSARHLRVYGNDLFAILLADLYGLHLISPDEAEICELEHWTKRRIALGSANDLSSSKFPLFIKSLVPKQFASKVYSSFEQFISEPGVMASEEVLYCEPVKDIMAEARAFILNRQILDIAIYEGSGNGEEARIFLETFLADETVILPGAIVLDLAYSKDKKWFLLEWNAAWGAGLNGCNADNVVSCIAEASANVLN